MISSAKFPNGMKRLDNKKQQLLLIDDERDYLEMLSLALTVEGFDCLSAFDGRSGLEMFENHEIDLVICDVNMPEMNGFSLCRKIREAGHLTPFILLTSRDDVIDETLGLDIGADDYIKKPAKNELIFARVRALLRRTARIEDEKRELKLSLLFLDYDSYSVRWDKSQVEITPTEFKLLWKLANSPGRVFERDGLLKAMRGDESFVDTRMVDSYVNRIRRKLEAVGGPRNFIETVIGVGYRVRPNK